jgi:hypothetical protein
VNRLKGLKAGGVRGNGQAATKAKPRKEVAAKVIIIPALMQKEMTVTIVGDRPLLVNNKMSVAESLAAQYDPSSGGATGTVKPAPRTPDEQYAGSFYVMPDSKYPAPHPKGRYGVPASGIRKCMCTAIGLTGITDNKSIGRVQRSFWIMEDIAGLCLIKGRPQHDERMTQPRDMKVPKMAHRARWDEWSIKLRIKFNPLVLSEEGVVNLLMHAGQYVGLCEMRAEKKQGACGGFVADLPKGK